MAKSKLTDELIDEFCTYIENGMSNHDAIDLCDITDTTFYRWLREADERGPKGEKPQKYKMQRKLKAAIPKAAAAFKAYHVQVITRASKKNWQASAWMLERKFPDEYGRGVDRYMIQQASNAGAGKEDDGLIEALRSTGNKIPVAIGDEPEDV